MDERAHTVAIKMLFIIPSFDFETGECLNLPNLSTEYNIACNFRRSPSRFRCPFNLLTTRRLFHYGPKQSQKS
jgi:hypothetical protein